MWGFERDMKRGRVFHPHSLRSTDTIVMVCFSAFDVQFAALETGLALELPLHGNV